MGEPTFAGMGSKEEDAPIPAVRGTAIEPPESTQSATPDRRRSGQREFGTQKIDHAACFVLCSTTIPDRPTGLRVITGRAAQCGAKLLRHSDRTGIVQDSLAACGFETRSASLVFLLYQKGRDSRIFQAQDGYDRRDSEQQQVTADEDRGQAVSMASWCLCPHLASRRDRAASR